MTMANTAEPEPYRRPIVRFRNTYRYIKRVADQAGHLWPTHAHTCKHCGWPIDSTTYPIHPNCEATR